MNLEATHSKRGPNWIPVYARLPDGLHPSDSVAKKITLSMCKAAKKTMNVQY